MHGRHNNMRSWQCLHFLTLSQKIFTMFKNPTILYVIKIDLNTYFIILYFHDLYTNMVASCSAHGCVNRQTNDTKNHFFTRFSLRNLECNAKWLKAVGQKYFIPTKNSRLCDEHIVKSDFKTLVGGSYKLLLQDDAVPSIFNSSVKQTSQSSISQQSNISTNVSYYSNTRVL